MLEQGLRSPLAIGLVGLAGLGGTIAAPPTPRFVWNVSASAPIGLYRVKPGARLVRGDFVIARVPRHWRMFAATRRYIPANVPLVKRVAAMPGDRVCAIGNSIFINRRRAALRLARDGLGRPMPWWQGCITLGGDSFFLLMPDSAGSFDGRYFGPTPAAEIVGKADLIWSR